jgi:hypothetical protein
MAKLKLELESFSAAGDKRAISARSIGATSSSSSLMTARPELAGFLAALAIVLGSTQIEAWISAGPEGGNS